MNRTRGLRRVVLGAAILMAGCMGQEITVVGPGNPAAGGTGSGGAGLTLTITPATGTLAVGAGLQLTLTLRDSLGALVPIGNVTWTSSNSAVLSVNPTGHLSSVGVGTARINATTAGVAATATFSVVATPVASVTVTPGSATLQLGTSAQFSALLRDAAGNNLTGRVVSWSSSNPLALTVDATGLAHAAAVGTAVLTATSEGQSGTASVTVSNIPVASVQIAPSADTVQIGQQIQLVATPQDASGNPLKSRPVSWSSSAPTVARVSGNGLIDGLAQGVATISATSEGQTGTAAVTVIPVPVATVTVVPQSVTVQVGATTTFNATPRDANGNALTGRTVTWSSADPNIAQVSATGIVSGIAPGSVLISATIEGVVGSAFVTVTTASATLVSVTIAPQTAALQSRQTQLFTLTGLLSDNSTVPVSGTYTATAGSVNGGGLYTAPDSSGSFLVIGTASGTSLRDTATVTVTRSAVATVTVTPASGTVNVGQTLGLAATMRDASGTVLTNRVVTWSSGNAAVATVNGSGLVTGVAVGSATITATSEGQSGTAAITVQVTPVASVQVSPSAATVEVGLTTQLSATARDANGNVITGRAVTWASNAPTVASVNGAGLVTALAAGPATITATIDGRTGSAAITAVRSPVATVTISPSTVGLAISQTRQLTATPRDAAGNALLGRVITWATSAAGVATVSGTGLVTAQGTGAATITATCEGQSGTAGVTVFPPPAPTPGEPVYDAANPDHKLHVYETWQNQTTIANFETANRADGGPKWRAETGRFILTYGSVVAQPDPFGSSKYISIDFSSNPPIAPHGAQGSCTDPAVVAAHNAGYHWAGAATGTYCGDDNATGSGWIRGFELGGYLNKPLKDAVVIEWAMRYRGNNWYEGKHVDIGAGSSSGFGRWLFDHFGDPFGIGGTNNCTDAMCQRYYTNNGNTPRFAGLPLTSKTPSFAVHHSSNDLTPMVGTSFIVYKQNRLYGLNAGEHAWGWRGNPDQTPQRNTDFTGRNVPWWQAGWMYFKWQITREPNTSPYVYGRGRHEFWAGPTPGSLHKVFEYLGDPGALDAGSVFVAPTLASVFPERIAFFHPTARLYSGGAILDVGMIRIWSHSRQ